MVVSMALHVASLNQHTFVLRRSDLQHSLESYHRFGFGRNAFPVLPVYQGTRLSGLGEPT